MLKHCIYKKEKVAFSDTGNGRAVVLLHGFLGSHEIWNSTIQDISRSYRVIAIDLPGHGDTPCFGYAHSMDLMARCVKAVITHLRIKKCVMIGHSMGGYVALAFADHFPDMLSGLVLFHSTSYADSEEKKRDRMRAIQAVKADRGLYTRNTIKNLFAAKNLKYLKKEIAFATRIAKSTNKSGIIAALHGMKDRPARDIILTMVNYPILMVIGEHDNVLPSAQLKEQVKLLNHGAELYLKHDGHFGFLESPRKSNQQLRKFLRKCA